MKKYLVTLFSEKELANLRAFYQEWDFPMLRDVDANLEAYQKFGYSSVDLIYLLWKRLSSPEEFGGITSANLFITKKGAYYFDSRDGQFRRFEDGSEIHFPRIQGVEKEFIAFFKSYALAAFGIRLVLSYDFRFDFFGTKRFGAYWGKVGGCEKRIPNMAIPLMAKESDPKIFRDFLQSPFWVGNETILKIDGSSWGRGIYAFDVKDPKDASNFAATVGQLKESGKTSLAVFERLDVRDYEIRLLWVKDSSGVRVIKAYKKVRLPWQLLHNVSQGNEIWELASNEIPPDLQESVKSFCSVIIDNHGGLDVLVAKNGKDFYFTENNVLTGYLDEPMEIPFLKEWLDAVSETHVG